MGDAPLLRCMVLQGGVMATVGKVVLKSVSLASLVEFCFWTVIKV